MSTHESTVAHTTRGVHAAEQQEQPAVVAVANAAYAIAPAADGDNRSGTGSNDAETLGADDIADLADVLDDAQSCDQLNCRNCNIFRSGGLRTIL